MDNRRITILLAILVVAIAGSLACESSKAQPATGTVDHQQAGQWVDPSNKSDELVNGPYQVDANWPKPLSTWGPDEKGWTWGAVQGVFAQNPNRIFVAMRGELPDVTNVKKAYVELQTASGLTA